MPPSEKAWLALHTLDVAQTVQIARSSCYWESNGVTSKLIGKRPSTAGVLTWGVGVGVLHYGVTRWLEHVEAPRWVRVSWQAVTITNTAYMVKQNNDQGIKPWGTEC